MGEAEGQIGVVTEKSGWEPIDIDDPRFTDPSRRLAGSYYDASPEVGPRVVDFIKLADKDGFDNSGKGFFVDAGQSSKFATEGEGGANISVVLIKDEAKPVYKVKLSLKEKKSDGYTPEVYLTKHALDRFKQFLKEPPEEASE